MAVEVCGYTVAGIVEELCARAGMDPRSYAVQQLAALQCRGFTVVNQYAATGALSALAQVFLFDPSNYGGVVHFVPRGANAVTTVDETDLVVVQQADGAPDPMQAQMQRGDSVAIPQTLNLNYYDVDGGLTTSLQVSQRVGDPRATGSRDLQTAVMLSADEAARVARINHQVAVEEARAQFNFTLSDRWLQLTPADTVFLQYRGKPWRLRLTQITMNDGMQDYQALVDRQSAYTSDLQGYPAYAPTPPPSPVVGPTVIEPLDIHIISDTDDSLGCYVALGRGAPAWQGAIIDVSLDGGASYFNSFTLTAAAAVGTLGSALPAHPAEYPDAASHCTVDLLYDQDELEAASQTQMQNGVNLAIVGDEVLQFGDAAETSTPGTWELGYFFRGRKGTAAVAHAAGERFVLLERNSIAFIPMQLSYLGRTLTIRATSLNGSDSDVTTASLTYTGQSQTEYPVAYLRGRRNGAASLLQWQGVGKLGAGATVAMGVHFAGYLVTLTDGTTTQQDTVTQQSYTFNAADFTGPITATVQAVNALTGNGPAVQIII